MRIPTPFAGIAYPDALRACGLIHPMKEALSKEPSFDISRTGPIEAAQVGLKLCQNEGLILVGDLDLRHEEALLERLKRRGISFKENPDSHTLLLALYKEFDKECLLFLEGSFAFAIIDSKKEQIFLARDRIGKKGLIWSHQRDHFLFASELAALLASGLIPANLSKEALPLYLFLGYFPQDTTPIEGVHKLLPAHILTYQFGKSVSVSNYWSLSHAFKKNNGVNIAEEEISLSLEIPQNTYDDVGNFNGKKITLDELALFLDMPQADPLTLSYLELFRNNNDSSGLYLQLGKKALATPLLATQNEAQIPFSRFSLLPKSFVRNCLIPFVFLFSKRSGLNLLRFSGTAPAEFDYIDKGRYFSEWQLKEAFPQLAESFGIDTFLHKFYNLPSIEYPLSALLYLDLKTKIPDSLLQMAETFSRRFAIPYEAPFLEASFVEKLAVFVESYQTIPECLNKNVTESDTSDLQNMLILDHLSDLENGFLIQTSLLSKNWLQTEVAHFKKTKEGGRPLWALLILEKWMAATGITFGV